MVVKPEQDRVRNLLTDTVTLLCKNGLTYNKEMKVQGLLGITLDEDEVFVVHIDEKFSDLLSGGKELSSIEFPESLQLDTDNNECEISTSNKKRRKRRTSKDSDSGSLLGNPTPVKRNRDSEELQLQDSQEIQDVPDFPEEVRVKQEQPDDIVCLEDDPADVKPDPLHDTSFPQFTPQQTNPPYMPGLVPNMPPGNTSHVSDNSNASWDGTSKLPDLAAYEGGGTPGSASASWNAGDASVGAIFFTLWFLC